MSVVGTLGCTHTVKPLYSSSHVSQGVLYGGHTGLFYPCNFLRVLKIASLEGLMLVSDVLSSVLGLSISLLASLLVFTILVKSFHTVFCVVCSPEVDFNGEIVCFAWELA